MQQWTLHLFYIPFYVNIYKSESWTTRDYHIDVTTAKLVLMMVFKRCCWEVQAVQVQPSVDSLSCALPQLWRVLEVVAMPIRCSALPLHSSSTVRFFRSCRVCVTNLVWLSVACVELRHWSDLSHRSAGLTSRFWGCEVTKDLFTPPVFQQPNLFFFPQESNTWVF